MADSPSARQSLADTAAERLRTWIASGAVTDADQLSEPALAERLGISRTPLREAIQRLRREGFLESKGHRLAIVRVNAALVREVYPLIGALEGMALRLSSPDALPGVRELTRINAAIGATTSRSQLAELDRSFHERLSAGCPNERLRSLLAEQRRLAARIDGGSRRGLHDPAWSSAQHAAIIAAIARREIQHAATLVATHFLEGAEVVVDWMERQK